MVRSCAVRTIRQPFFRLVWLSGQNNNSESWRKFWSTICRQMTRSHRVDGNKLLPTVHRCLVSFVLHVTQTLEQTFYETTFLWWRADLQLLSQNSSCVRLLPLKLKLLPVWLWRRRLLHLKGAAHRHLHRLHMNAFTWLNQILKKSLFHSDSTWNWECTCCLCQTHLSKPRRVINSTERKMSTRAHSCSFTWQQGPDT